MRFDFSCYGDMIPALLGRVDDFELRSPMDVHAWYRGEWQAIARQLGFSEELAQELAPLRVARDRITATNQAGVNAFTRWLASRQPVLSEDHARAQERVLEDLLVRADGQLWRLYADPSTLSSGACYAERGQFYRAFYPDTAPGYFGDGWTGPPPRAESACGWTTPLVLHLGSFPWVYSSRLEGEGVGLRWTSSATRPARIGMRVVARLLDPSANIRQDAREVAAIFEHFRVHTGGLAGDLRDDLDGPRGRVSARAYNYVMRRFASFFAVRRATLRALRDLPRDVQELAAISTDPCLRAHAQEVARVG